MLFVVSFFVISFLIAACQTRIIKDDFPQSPQIDPKDLEDATRLMAENGIPLSLFNIGDFKTEVSRVIVQTYDKTEYPNSPYLTSTHVTLRYKYNGIPIVSENIFHFNDGKLGPYVSGYILYPKEKSNLILGKGLDDYLTFIDFLNLPSKAKITRERAVKIAQEGIKSWPYFAKTYSVELNYYPVPFSHPGNLTLVWSVQSTKNSAAIVVIDAESGKILYDFDGVYT